MTEQQIIAQVVSQIVPVLGGFLTFLVVLIVFVGFILYKIIAPGWKALLEQNIQINSKMIELVGANTSAQTSSADALKNLSVVITSQPMAEVNRVLNTHLEISQAQHGELKDMLKTQEGTLVRRFDKLENQMLYGARDKEKE